MDEEDSIHDQLVQAYLEYFKANEWWERNESVRSYAAVQQATKKIQKLILEKNKENKERFNQRRIRRRALRSNIKAAK